MLTYAHVCRKRRRWRCVRAGNLWEGITCPLGMFKKSRKEVQVLNYLTLGTNISNWEGIRCPAGMFKESKKEAKADSFSPILIVC